MEAKVKELEEKLKKIELEKQRKIAELKEREESLISELDLERKKSSDLETDIATTKRLMEEKLEIEIQQKVVLEKKVQVLEKKLHLQVEKQLETPLVPLEGFLVIQDVYVPQDVRFVSNDLYKDRLPKVFNKERKIATGIHYDACFKTSCVFTAGKKFYFQASVTPQNGLWHMGIGLLQGDVKTHWVAGHEKGWEYDLYPYCRDLWHNGEWTRRRYGLLRMTDKAKIEKHKLEKFLNGKHRIGMYCDFTDGKGEVSFIIDGKDFHIAWKNVEPPVSPAFWFFYVGDKFQIDEVSELPKCLVGK